MNNTYLINGLINKRSEKHGEIEYHKKELKRLFKEIDSIDSTIHIIDPKTNLNIIKPKRYNNINHLFKRGELSQYILETLRQTNNPYSLNNMIESVKEIKKTDRDIAQSIRNALLNLEKSSVIESINNNGNKLWRIKDEHDE